MEALKLSNLSVARGSFRLGSIDLSVDEREYFVVIGPTGSGKTTLLKTIAGAFGRVAGNVSLNGTDVTSHPPEKRGIAYVPQNYSLFNHMSVYRNIEFGLKVRRLPREAIRETIGKISEELGIADLLDRSPSSLSGGEQQKVSLARALATSPRLLLLDEPLSMVDPETKSRLLVLLKGIPQKHDCPVMHVTHDWDETYALASRIAVINKGVIVEVGNPQSIFERPRSHFTARLTGFQNIITATAVRTENGSVVELGRGTKLSSSAKVDGKVYACVRPEWVVTDVREGDNVLVGRITGTLRERHGARLMVLVDGVEFSILARKELAVGDEVTFQIPSNALHLIPADQNAA
jgi:molybdate/tungstate transport system ATP-binding protein